MFGHNRGDKEAGHRLLGRDLIEDEETSHGGTVWERKSSMSDRDTASHSEIWDQDPLHQEEGNELQQISTLESRHRTAQRSRGAEPSRLISRPGDSQPEDHGEAATELEEEFERIFTPVRR
jgi:hypothetical protein